MSCVTVEVELAPTNKARKHEGMPERRGEGEEEEEEERNSCCKMEHQQLRVRGREGEEIRID